MTSAAPDPHRHDGDPLFEVLVYGWTVSTDAWNGERPAPSVRGSRPGPVRDRGRLADDYDQYLEQSDADPDTLRETGRLVDAIRRVDGELQKWRHEAARADVATEHRDAIALEVVLAAARRDLTRLRSTPLRGGGS